MNIEEFLRIARSREPSVRESVAIWLAQYPSRKGRRKQTRSIFDNQIAPDGRPYSDGPTPFAMPKPRGAQ